MNFLWKKRKPGAIATSSHNETATSTEGETIADSIATKLSFKVQTLSETGPSRQDNEDSILYFYPAPGKETLFAMVADGMGGHNAGEVASNMACQAAKSYITRQYSLANSAAMLEILMQQMHQYIRNAAQENEGYTGMGTTAVALFIHNLHVHLASVGDSRIYYYSNNVLQQLTRDQTLVSQMISEGKITKEEGRHHELKHVLLQALGTVIQIKPEIISLTSPVKPGDKFFLCSDGVYDMLSNAELVELLSMTSVELIIECVKALCMQRRARDNFSAILIEVVPYRENEINLETKEQNILV